MFSESRKLKVRESKKTFLGYLWDEPEIHGKSCIHRMYSTLAIGQLPEVK